jgi:hypothetical protein
MVEDASGVILFGGYGGFVPGHGCPYPRAFADTWSYSAGRWSRRAPSFAPHARYDASTAYDTASGQVLLFGGIADPYEILGDTWAFRPVGSGYRMAASDGGLFVFGARFEGSAAGRANQSPIVGMAPSPDGVGYWLAGSDGSVFAFGAPGYGSARGLHLGQPVVGIAPVPYASGYRIATADGQVVTLGRGTGPRRPTPPLHLNHPIVGIASDPVSGGYHLVASDGGVFTVDAKFFGSTGGMHLNKPIVGVADDPATGGYWLVASDGGVFSFGPGAAFHGSAGNLHLNRPIVAKAGQ